MKLATGFLSPTDDSSPREFEWDCLIVYDDSAHGAHAIAMLGHPRNTDLFEGLSAREMNMRALRNASAYGVGILGLVLTALTADTARAALPSLDGVSWHGPSTTLDALAGKTVVVLTYVTWCPKCNEWSPNLFNQLRTAVEDKPVVVLAICTEDPSVPGYDYLSERKFVAPNILYGTDETMNSKIGLSKDQLFGYALISPKQEVVEKDAAGTFYDQGSTKDFVVASKLRTDKNQGKLDFVDPKQSASVKEVLWQLELGRPVPDAMLVKVRRQLKPSDQVELDRAIEHYASEQLTQGQKLAGGSLTDKLEAYGVLTGLAARFKSRSEAKEAAKAATELTKDKQFKTELAAKTQYAKVLDQVSATPARREALLKGFTSRFAGTHYATVAEEALAGKSP